MTLPNNVFANMVEKITLKLSRRGSHIATTNNTSQFYFRSNIIQMKPKTSMRIKGLWRPITQIFIEMFRCLSMSRTPAKVIYQSIFHLSKQICWIDMLEYHFHVSHSFQYTENTRVGYWRSQPGFGRLASFFTRSCSTRRYVFGDLAHV